eukprot:GHRR01004209.1.p2 GENE.GHRR01004209.1~~GHRR01004209.1.p2  ORF type:complete len:106 (-),score=30.09 GHRR01004209.1:228-545(-)
MPTEGKDNQQMHILGPLLLTSPCCSSNVVMLAGDSCRGSKAAMVENRTASSNYVYAWISLRFTIGCLVVLRQTTPYRLRVERDVHRLTSRVQCAVCSGMQSMARQ